MKIALVTYALRVGGVEIYLRHLADRLRARGHDVGFLETEARGEWSSRFAADGYPVRRVLPRAHRSRFHHVRRIAAALRSCDCVLLNDAPYAQAALGLLSRATVAIPVLHLPLPSMIRNAVAMSPDWDALVTVSPAGRHAVIAAGADESRVVCIPNGVPVGPLWPRERAAARSGPLRAIFVGTLNDAQKGVLLLPRIARLACAEIGPFALDIVGGGPDEPALRAALARECPECVVTLHGVVPNPEVQRLLGRADILVMPSRFEGLPLVLLEAMAAGVVPLVTRLPASTDVVVADGVSGLLVASGDAPGFARALVALARGPADLLAMSRQAWQCVRDRYSCERMGSVYDGLIDELRRRGRAPRSGTVGRGLLGDHPGWPLLLVRPLRKILRLRHSRTAEKSRGENSS